jgi:predicted RNase H-like HicB family nuclease
MMFTLEIEREEGGRWIAEIPKLPGVMKFGEALYLRIRRQNSCTPE